MLIMSIMAALSWQGISTVVNGLQITQAHDMALSSIASSLSQWQSDLDATTPLTPAPGVSSINWDGKVLRLVRKAPLLGRDSLDMGYQVVAWSARELNGEELAPLGAQFTPGLYWLRWQSPAFTSTRELNDYLEMAITWSQSATAPSRSRETALFPIAQWQIYFYRENAWSNALSSAGTSIEANTLVNTTGTSATPNNNNNSTSANLNTPSSPSVQTSALSKLNPALPSGIRLKIYLPNSNPTNSISQSPNSGLGGEQPTPSLNDGSITLDWVRPNFTPVRS